MQEIIYGAIFVMMCITMYIGYFYIKDYLYISGDRDLLIIGSAVALLSLCGMFVAIYGMAGVELAI